MVNMFQQSTPTPWCATLGSMRVQESILTAPPPPPHPHSIPACHQLPSSTPVPQSPCFAHPPQPLPTTVDLHSPKPCSRPTP
jgi:hypothetical protein